MPRPSKFASMPIAKIFELRDEIDQHLVERRKSLETEMAHLNSYVDGARKVTGKRSPMKGTKVKPKFRGPKGETWAGRGVHPTWLAALLKSGHKLEEYAIGVPAKLAAASKKVSRKVARKPASKAKRKRR